jgi:hypothetical protein
MWSCAERSEGGEGEIMTLIPGVSTDRQRVPLSASSHAAARTWFLDGARIGTAARDERVYWALTAGKHEIVVADDAGRKARRTVVVELAASRRAHRPRRHTRHHGRTCDLGHFCTYCVPQNRYLAHWQFRSSSVDDTKSRSGI